MKRIGPFFLGSLRRGVFLRMLFVCTLITSYCIGSAITYAKEQNVSSSHSNPEETDSATSVVGLSTDDVAYLTQLGLLRGHLMVGFELYRNSLPEMSETHMKHPNEELYADLIPAFESRGCAGFANELTELARVVSDRETIEVVTSNYEVLSASIARCEAVADRENRTVAMNVVLNLLANALLEYEIGVVDGTINNVHEYQDAWGFTKVAGEYLRLPTFTNDDEGRLIFKRLQGLITSLEPLWPSLNPTSIDDPTVASLLRRLRVYTSNAID